MSDLKQLYFTMRAALAQAVSTIVPVHDVEDVVQETYVKLCLVKNQEQITHPRSYLYQIAKNVAKDRVKAASFRLSDSLEYQPELESHQSDEVYRAAVSGEEFVRFCEAVRFLPLQCRRVFVLRKVYGFSQKEIAQELDIAESTVEKHIAQGLKRCAAHMTSTSLSGATTLKRENHDQ